MIRTTLTLLSLSLSLSLGLAAAPLAAQMADRERLAAALVGNTFRGDMGGGGYASYFGADGLYHDAEGSGRYEITEDGVCYPDTQFGCYQARIEDGALSWSQDGAAMGTGVILEGDPLGFTPQ